MSSEEDINEGICGQRSNISALTAMLGCVRPERNEETGREAEADRHTHTLTHTRARVHLLNVCRAVSPSRFGIVKDCHNLNMCENSCQL